MTKDVEMLKARIKLAHDDIYKIPQMSQIDTLFGDYLMRLHTCLEGKTGLSDEYHQAKFALFRFLTDSAAQENSLSGQIVFQLFSDLYQLEKAF